MCTVQPGLPWPVVHDMGGSVVQQPCTGHSGEQGPGPATGQDPCSSEAGAELWAELEKWAGLCAGQASQLVVSLQAQYAAWLPPCREEGRLELCRGNYTLQATRS